MFDARDNVDFNKLEASVELMSQEFEERSAQINVAHASLKTQPQFLRLRWI